MKSTRCILSAILLAGLALGGCVTQDDFQTLQSHVRNNRQTIQELKDRISQTEAELKRDIEASSTPVQTKQADLWVEMQRLQMQLATLQGQLEVGQRGGKVKSLPELAQEVEAMRFALQTQLGVDVQSGSLAQGNQTDAPTTASPEEQPQLAAPVSQQPGQAQPAVQQPTTPQPVPAAPAVQPPTSNDPAQALYDQAMAAFRDKQYDKAQRLWAEFAQTFKGHALKDNALFWQGEAYYQMGRYPEAILAYEEVKTKYPKSDKYRSALLKQGISFYRLGKKKAGTLVLNDLIKRYPQSAEAVRAKKFLENN